MKLTVEAELSKREAEFFFERSRLVPSRRGLQMRALPCRWPGFFSHGRTLSLLGADVAIYQKVPASG